MPTHALQDAIRAVERTLERPDALDEGDREALRHLHQLLAEVLRPEVEARAAGEQAPPEPARDARPAIREAVLRFEERHPQLAQALGRLADALAAMGL